MNIAFARRLALGAATTAVASLALAGGAMADSGSAGAFVIGDQTNLARGTQVTFWGAQWWKDNPLSTGLAPASFKGYAANTGTCGGTWTTRPGNSSDPPDSLSGAVPVIVSSAISKSGPVISGDIKAIVMVAPNPGYEGNPGHAGTGSIVGYVCGGGQNGSGPGQPGGNGGQSGGGPVLNI